MKKLFRCKGEVFEYVQRSGFRFDRFKAIKEHHAYQIMQEQVIAAQTVTKDDLPPCYFCLLPCFKFCADHGVECSTFKNYTNEGRVES